MPTDQSSLKSPRPRPVLLCVLDGWGERDNGADNAIRAANTPNLDRMYENCLHARLNASEHEVGLPDGQVGNSEVGHMNIGAGRVVMQDLPRIDEAVKNGSINALTPLREIVQALKSKPGVCHVIGLVSPGGVHSHQDHMLALVKALDQAGVQVRLHAFLDGRDTPPQSAIGYLTTVQKALADCTHMKFATVSGRYYAMDRDKNWTRVEKAYRAIAEGTGETAADPIAAVTASYAAGKNDEFVLPAVIGDYAGMKDGDALLMFNFRADRAREILTALVDPNFAEFARQHVIQFSRKVGMAEYSDALNKFLEALFPQRPLTHILGEIIAERGLTQLRIAETEKYAHVTFFLNGGEEKLFPGEERILVPSPKVATYDLQPEMSAFEVTDKLVAAIRSKKFDLIVVNYANGDMVGHTGVFEAAVKAAETVDTCLGRVEQAMVETGGTMLITADHGNAERMLDEVNHQPHTAHTLALVPFIVVNPPAGVSHAADGALADIAPTVLDIMDIPVPKEMTGHSLLTRAPVRRAASPA